MTTKPRLRPPKPPKPLMLASAPGPVDERPPEETGARVRGAFRVGRYEVNASLASGGMATVHLGRVLGAAGFSRVVAIKRLRQEFSADPEFETMFVEEAQLAERIRHPNVVPTLDVVASDGELLLVMEYVHGETLARLVTTARTAGGVSLPIALTVVCDTLHGLHAAHEAKDRNGQPLGLVHRDISPQNVMVGVDGVSRVIDFGIAKAVTSLNTTSEGLVRGKAAYMAPEQLSGEILTRRTDLYAVGVMLWELLTGDRLFPGGARADLLRKVEGHIAAPSTLAKALPRALDAITMRALATTAEDRFPDALQMAQAIERTGLVAPRSDVAQWVERLAAGTLAKRAELLASIESEARSVPPPPLSVAPLPAAASTTDALSPIVAGVPASHFQQTRRLPRPGILFGGAALLVVGVVAGLTLRRPPPEHAPTTNAAPEAVGTGPAVVPPRAVVPPTPPAIPAPEAEANVAPPVTPAAAPPVPTSAPAAKSSAARTTSGAGAAKRVVGKAKDCNPPYTIDVQGRRHYKAHCF